MHKPKKEGTEGNGSRPIVIKSVNIGVTVNYCPVCKREYKEMSGNQTRRCPVCGSTRVQIPDDTITQMHREK